MHMTLMMTDYQARLFRDPTPEFAPAQGKFTDQTHDPFKEEHPKRTGELRSVVEARPFCLRGLGGDCDFRKVLRA